MPETMRAVQFDSYGPPELLHITEVAVPRVRPGALLVRVAATSINGADVGLRSGALKLAGGRKFPRGTGFDFTGEVVETGEGVRGYAPGDAVWGFVQDAKTGPVGAAAEYVVAPVEAVARRPRALDAISAAALPGAAGAALGALRDVARVRSGDRVLIRGANGGVGTSAVQIAHALGAHVTALARAGQFDDLRELGADETRDYRSTDPRGLGKFDVILDPVGRDLPAFRKLLTRGGRMVTMALGGPRDIAYLLASQVFGPRRVRFAQVPPTHKLLDDIAGLVDNGSIRPVIDDRHALDDIAAAHRALDRGGIFGKHVIQVK